MNEEAAVNFLLDKIRENNDDNHISFLLPGYLARPLIAYQNMRQEMIFCKDATQFLLSSNLDKIVESSLWHTIISLYGKSFTDATNSKFPKLESSDCFDSTPELFKAHEKLINLRHNFVAHRGETEHNISIAYLKINLISSNRGVFVETLKSNKPKDEELTEYITLFDYLINKIEEKYRKAAERVSNNFLTTYKNELLMSLCIAKPSILEKNK